MTKRAFRVKRTYPKILRNRKQRIQRRLEPRSWEDQPKPMMAGGNIHYEMAEKVAATPCGGIGAMHTMIQNIGLPEDIDQHLSLLKLHLPYHESDHVLNIAYNTLVGGRRLEEIELRRQDESFLNGLGAQRIPDPTTAGDFTRRFKDEEDITALQDCINRARQVVWDLQPKRFMREAFIDIDGTIAPTCGECKEGMDISHKGIWGYGPLIISCANQKEVLYLVNRPANVPSHAEAVPWINKAIQVVQPYSKYVHLRGDTDFALTEHFDGWTDQGTRFTFGIDSMRNLVVRAEKLPKNAWKLLHRDPKYRVKTLPRRKPENVKEKIVKERRYENLRLKSEAIAEFRYQPGKCQRAYRIVVVRKNISVEKGEDVLFDELRYLFYITNDFRSSPKTVVRRAMKRCDQENVIEQLKNGINAMRMPVDCLLSNWAYMVMASLSWNIKAWYGLLMPNRQRGQEIMRMEFRRFLHTFVLIPCQIIRTGRTITYRLLSYNDWLKDFVETFQRVSSNWI